MNRITTVGDMRALLARLPDNAVLRPAHGFVTTEGPGLYLLVFAEGTCNAAYAEVLVQPQNERVVIADPRNVYDD